MEVTRTIGNNLVKFQITPASQDYTISAKRSNDTDGDVDLTLENNEIIIDITDLKAFTVIISENNGTADVDRYSEFITKGTNVESGFSLENDIIEVKDNKEIISSNFDYFNPSGGSEGNYNNGFLEGFITASVIKVGF